MGKGEFFSQVGGFKHARKARIHRRKVAKAYRGDGDAITRRRKVIAILNEVLRN